jgi:hypothetical protein
MASPSTSGNNAKRAGVRLVKARVAELRKKART